MRPVVLLLLNLNIGCFNLLSKCQKEIRKDLATQTEKIDGNVIVYFRTKHNQHAHVPL